MALLRDLTDDELRASRRLKWSMTPPGVLPTWVAEMDFALADVVTRRLHHAIELGSVGYSQPAAMTGVAPALASFAARHWGWDLDPDRVTLTGDVLDGVLLTLRHLAEPGPVIVPTPSYPPFLELVPLSGHELVTVPQDPGADHATLDLAALEDAIRAGARTLVLCHPHNPLGRSWTRAELQGLRDLVEPHGVRVISDEIHAPLTLPGHTHVPYATVAGPDAPVTTLTAATKAFSMPGLRCAQLVSHTAQDHARISAVPFLLNHAMTTLGAEAAVAAFTEGDPWLEELLQRLEHNHRLFTALVRDLLPRARTRPAEATYLAWLDARAYGLEHPGTVALEHAGVFVDSREFGPGGQGHVRVNLGTSPERVEQIVERLALAWER